MKILFGLLIALAVSLASPARAQTSPGNCGTNSIVGNNGGGVTCLTGAQAGAIISGGASNGPFRMATSDCGADNTGVADATTAIQNCINALPTTGGVIFFTVGTYKISSTLTIGNGSNSAASTRQGVVLMGSGEPPNSFNGTAAPTGVDIKWAGGASDMLHIVGPLSGWGLQNLTFDCNSTATAAVTVISAAYGSSNNLILGNNCTIGTLVSTTWAPFSGVSNADSLHNYYRTVVIAGIKAGAVGISLDTGDPVAPTSDTDYNVFDDVTLQMPSTATNTSGIYLRGADSNVFRNVHFFGVTCSGCAAVVFDYRSNGSFPSSNIFEAIDPFTYPQGFLGTPSGTGGNNEFHGVYAANGARAIGTIGGGASGFSVVDGHGINLEGSSSWFADDAVQPTISRLGDRVFVGDAARGYPATSGCGTGDWFSTFEATTSNGACGYTGVFSMIVVSTNLTTSQPNSNPSGAILGAGQTLNNDFGGAFGGAFFGLNNNINSGTTGPAGAGGGWAIYGECDQTVNAATGCFGAELETGNFVSDALSLTAGSHFPDPFAQVRASDLQIGCGSGLATPTPFKCGAAEQILDVGNQFRLGINIFNGSIVPQSIFGATASVAIAMPESYGFVWYSAANTPAGAIEVDGSGNLLLAGSSLKFNGTTMTVP